MFFRTLPRARFVFLPFLGFASLHPRAGSPAEHLGWRARLYAGTHFAGSRGLNILAKLLQTITGLHILVVLALLGVAVIGWRVYARQQKRRARIALLTEGVDVLAQWTYTPEEWRRAREEEFTWASRNDNRDYGGRVYISPTTIYVQGEHRDRLIDLEGEGRVVTHASYRGATESPLKLRVRWKTITRRHNGPEEIQYHKEDYRIPVPSSAKESAPKVVEYFTARMGENPDADVSLVSDDEVISVFGKDAF